jgi:hypothetical protein
MSYGLPAEGTRRLRQGLGVVAAGACLLAFATFIAAHGPPWQTLWWAVMLAILITAFFIGRLFAPFFEWVIAGYRGPS